MLTNKEFVHLHVHSDRDSNIRFKDSIAKVKDIITYSASLGNKGVALTGHESLTSHVLAINTLNELKQNGEIPQDFKLILGNEIYLVSQQDMEKDNKEFYHFILLALDEIGHSQLRELSTRAWTDNFFNYKGIQRPTTYYSDVEEVIGDDRGHLICASACLGSKLGKLSQKIDETEDEEQVEFYKDEMAEHIDWCIDTFGYDNVYLEMQPNLSESQINYNQLLVNIANAYELPMIVTTDVHFISEEDRASHKAFLTSEDKDSNREIDDFYETTRFFDIKEFYQNMSYLKTEDLEQALLNTVKIVNRCVVGENNDYGLFKGTEIPLTPLPTTNWKEETKKYLNDINNYEYIQKIYEDKYEYHTYLIYLIFKGLELKQIPYNNREEYLDRINQELTEIYILSEGMSQPIGAYLTTMSANLNIMWETSIVGVGRGSSCCYEIDYLLEITDVDPIKIRKQTGIELPIWRFIHRSKFEMPDVDCDSASHLKNEIFYKTREYYRSFEGDMCRIATFRTETSKSAVKTACRGKGVNNDVAQYMASLVPVERGKVWSISDVIYGNPKKNRQPIKEFIDLVDKYKEDNLLEAILKIENLVSGVSSHASGVLPINSKITKYSSAMKTPNGEIISSFDLHEIEKCGAIKYDYLLTSAISLIQVTIEFLCEYGYMEWQGDLKSTYMKYLSPSVIDLEDKEMWDNIKQNKVMSLFQFYDSPVGREAIAKLQPNDLNEIGICNSLMRLMATEDGTVPMDKYIAFKENPQLWEKEMIDFGLNDEERKVCHKLMDKYYGVANTQEDMMELFLAPEVSNFGIKEVNIAKKGVGKKNEKCLKQFEEMLYERQKELGTSKKIVDYCWQVQTSYQRGYAFSRPHVIAYSLIAIQEAWLFTKYPPIFWYLANLIVMTESYEADDDEDIEYDFEIKDKNTNYGKVAKAISDIKQDGVVIDFPNINQSQFGFIPDIANNTILFGLKGITAINEEACNTIIENRPYKSMRDFYDRLIATKRPVIQQSTGKTQMKSYISNTQMLNLIKSGSFDKLENKDRTEIMLDYMLLVKPPKVQLSDKDILIMEDRGLIPEEFQQEFAYTNFRKFVLSLPKYQDEDTSAIIWHIVDCQEDTEYVTNFFLEHFAVDMTEDRDYRYNDEGLLEIAMKTKRKGSFENVHSIKVASFKRWLLSADCVDFYNNLIFEENKKEYLKGGISKWEMDSISYYYHDHELEHVDKEKYNISNFLELPEEPVVRSYNTFTDKKTKETIKYPIYEINNIVGTVLDRNKNKHTVTLLTPQGVITVKFYAGQFNFYDKKISVDSDEVDKKTGKKKKITLEDGWFKKGNLLFITGYRRNDSMMPKRYKNSIYQHTVQLIKEVREDGTMTFQSDRTRVE